MFSLKSGARLLTLQLTTSHS